MPDPVPTQPNTYPRRVLLSATGLSPQVVTETVYALAVQDEPKFVPTEVHLLTTVEGRRGAETSLLQGKAWLRRLCEEYALPHIDFSAENIHVIVDREGQPLDDIRTAEDNEDAANRIADKVRELTADPDCALHVSIAGGRKTMGYYTGYALSLYGRAQDRLSHVLVSEPFERSSDFFYPSREPRYISAGGKRHDASTARVTLASIPFVRLREGLPEDLVVGSESFGNAVRAAQHFIGPPELVIDHRGKRIRANGHDVRLPPKQLAFLAWLARRRIRGEDGVSCPAEGTFDESHGQGFMAEYQVIVGEMGNIDEMAATLSNGMYGRFFSETKSNLHKNLRAALNSKLGRVRAENYLVVATGRKGYRRYGLDLPPSSIHIEADS